MRLALLLRWFEGWSMRPQQLALAGAILVLCPGCLFKKKPKPEPVPVAAPTPAPAPPAPAPTPPADFMEPVEESARLYYDDAAVFTDSVRVTVRDQTSLESLWSRAASGQASSPQLPKIDWERDMVVLVSAGALHPGDQIRVDSVGTREGRTVTVVAVRTTIQCSPFPTTSYPFEIVRVRRSDVPVVFLEHRAETGDCAK
jgi:hypothetical protein